jgi:hypothetical protein
LYAVDMPSGDDRYAQTTQNGGAKE